MPLSETEELEMLRLRKRKAMAGGAMPKEAGKSHVDQIPDMPPEQPKPAAAKPSLGERVEGAGQAAIGAATAGVAVPVGAFAGLLKGLTGGKLGTQEGVREGEETASDVSKAMTYQPRSEVGREYLGKFGEFLDTTKIAGLNPSEGMAGASMSGPAMTAVKSGAGKVGRTIAESPEAELVKQGVSKAKAAVTPVVAQDVAALARKAQAIGIDIRPDMLTDNKFARLIGEALEKVPLSGSKTEQRQVAFNRAIMNIIGADDKATRLTPDVFDKAFTKAGSTIGEISERTPVPMDADFQASLQSHLANTSKETVDVTKVVSGYVQDLHKATENGAIPGIAFRKINSQIGAQIRGSSNGDLRRALGGLQEDMHEALTRQLSGEDLAALQDARKKYAISIKLIPLVAKSPLGDISPAGLMQTVTSDKSGKRAMARGMGGDVGELAKIGQLFLKEPGSSGTAERALVYGGMLGGGAYVEPHTAAGIYSAANLYNRAGPWLARKMTGYKPGSKFAKMVETAQPEPPIASPPGPSGPQAGPLGGGGLPPAPPPVPGAPPAASFNNLLNSVSPALPVVPMERRLDGIVRSPSQAAKSYAPEVQARLEGKEAAAAKKREGSNYIGKEVSVDGLSAKVLANPFGRVSVQFEDGRKFTVDADRIKPKGAEADPALMAAGLRPPKVQSLLAKIKEMGGIDPSYAQDLTGESKMGAKGVPLGMFATGSWKGGKGTGLDDLATRLEAEGWPISTADADGGVGRLSKMIRDELGGKKTYSFADSEMVAAYERDVRMFQDAEEAKPIAEEIKSAGLAASDEVDGTLTNKALEIDEGAVERLAIQYPYDEASFMQGIKEIINGKDKGAKAAGAVQAVPQAEAGGFGLEGETEAQIRAREAAQRIASEKAAQAAKAPLPQDFVLSGSSRNADEAAARGQTELSGMLDSTQPLPTRQGGGPVTPGRPYVVGEKGPEIVVPNQPGIVLPSGFPMLLAGAADAMDSRAQAAYKVATGETIDARGQPAPIAPQAAGPRSMTPEERAQFNAASRKKLIDLLMRTRGLNRPQAEAASGQIMAH